MRRGLPLALLAAVAVAVSVVAPIASGDTVEDLRTEREEVRAERARVAAQIDTSEASLAEITAALEALEENRRTQEAALARTEGEIAQAVEEIARAEEAIERLTAEVDLLRGEIRRRAVQAYISPPSQDVLSVLEADDFTTASTRKFFIELRAQSDAEIADSLDGATKDLDHARAQASEAKETAEAKRVEQLERAEAVREAQAQQQQVASDLQASMDAQLARSVELATTDQNLARQIAEEQAAIAARLAAQRAAEQERARKAEAERAARDQAARDRAATQAATTSTPGGSGGGGGGSTPAPSPPPPPPPPPPPGPGISLCTVRGITVNCALQSRLAAMLDAAAADGISMGGGGYRDPSGQIRARMSNCGTSHYAIYQMPASACRPPTARPGTSQHEIGMAVDFSYQGRTICYPYATCAPGTNAAYDWLVANASGFGFHKLASEAWHWSPSGS